MSNIQKLDFETYRHAVVGYFCVTGTNKQWALNVIDDNSDDIYQAYEDGVYHGDWCRKFIDRKTATRG